MKVKYLGESKSGKEDRFAVISASAKDEEKVYKMLEYTWYNAIDVTGDDEDIEFWVLVDSKEDYNNFMKLWKEAKKVV